MYQSGRIELLEELPGKAGRNWSKQSGREGKGMVAASEAAVKQ